MSDVDVRVNALKERAKAAEKMRLLHEHKKAIAESDFERAQEIIREEFGVSSPEEAKQLMQVMEQDLEAVLSEAEDKLAEVEGSA